MIFTVREKEREREGKFKHVEFVNCFQRDVDIYYFHANIHLIYNKFKYFTGKFQG